MCVCFETQSLIVIVPVLIRTGKELPFSMCSYGKLSNLEQGYFGNRMTGKNEEKPSLAIIL